MRVNPRYVPGEGYRSNSGLECCVRVMSVKREYSPMFVDWTGTGNLGLVLFQTVSLQHCSVAPEVSVV